MELGTVRLIDIDQEMQTAYLDYAMSVIVARALPDVRDGLKPVQRRILYAMHDMGLRSDRPYKKSARIVGECLGKYHPHGDAAVYEAMARMAQDFSLRYPLVDGQGNFGSIDGDNPAAMRYTEARLSPIAEEMLADLDKDTVDFGPNFDGTLSEPLVLPAVLPNLLVNGASGIAVGMTTNVPPHNLGEVCDALIYLIDHYAHIDDVTVEDLMGMVQGPDFPTGGVVYRYAGESEDGDRNDVILNAYAMGRGQFTVQARAHIEEMSRNRSRIVVTELPYQVNKTRLIERIAELVRDGKLEGITDLRDESDRQGMRLTIEMTRTVEPRVILSRLFKLTPMQVTFGMMMVALVDGEPRTLSLKKVLTHYLDHRQDVITRRSKYLLQRAKERAHILEGLLIALDHIDEVIALIRRSRTTDTAREGLMKQFKLTEIQAQAILDMPLKRLAALERKRIADEHKEKLDEIKYLEGLLRSPAKLRGVIRDELVALKEKYGDPRRTQIVDREKGYHTTHDLVEAEEVVVTLYQGGEVSRSAQPPAIGKSMPLAQLFASTRDQVAFFAASGQAVVASVHQVSDDRGTAVSSLTNLDRTETLVSALVLPQATAAPESGEGEAGAEAAPAYLTLATRGGRIKRVTVEDFAAAAARGAVSAINVEEGDRLGWVAVTGGKDEVVLVTRQGKAIRFAEEEVRAMGLSAAGVLAVKLADDAQMGAGDAVVGMGIYRDKAFVVTITDQGLVKKTSAAEFPVQKRYGGGVQAAKVGGRTGVLAVAALADEGQRLALLTDQGQVITAPVRALPTMARATAGQKKRTDTKESLVERAQQGTPTAVAVLAAAPGPGNGAGPAPDGNGPPAPKRGRAGASPNGSGTREDGAGKPKAASGKPPAGSQALAGKGTKAAGPGKGAGAAPAAGKGEAGRAATKRGSAAPAVTKGKAAAPTASKEKPSVPTNAKGKTTPPAAAKDKPSTPTTAKGKAAAPAAAKDKPSAPAAKKREAATPPGGKGKAGSKPASAATATAPGPAKGAAAGEGKSRSGPKTPAPDKGVPDTPKGGTARKKLGAPSAPEPPAKTKKGAAPAAQPELFATEPDPGPTDAKKGPARKGKASTSK